MFLSVTPYKLKSMQRNPPVTIRAFGMKFDNVGDRPE